MIMDTPLPAPAPLLVCLSAAADHELRDALGRHLSPVQSSGGLRYWHPGLLSPGADPLRTTRQQLREAALVLPLLSDGFYSDSLCQALRPHLDGVPSERVLPLLARPVAYERAEDGLAAKQRLPRDGAPLQRADRDSAFVAVVHEVVARLQEVGPRPAEAAGTEREPAPAQAAGAT